VPIAPLDGVPEEPLLGLVDAVGAPPPPLGLPALPPLPPQAVPPGRHRIAPSVHQRLNRLDVMTGTLLMATAAIETPATAFCDLCRIR